jgi:hypothetical protein
LETTSIYLTGSFLYVAAGAALGWGGKWRLYIWHNFGLLIAVLGLLVFNFFVIFLPSSYAHALLRLLTSFRYDPLDLVSYWLEVVPSKFAWRLAIVILGVGSAATLMFWELIVVAGPVAGFFRRRTGTGRKQQLEDEEHWIEEEEGDGEQLSAIDHSGKKDEEHVTLEI